MTSTYSKPKSSIKSASKWQIFRWPLLFFVTSLIGLIAALVGNDWLDTLSWVSLGAIILFMCFAYYIKPKTSDSH